MSVKLMTLMNNSWSANVIGLPPNYAWPLHKLLLSSKNHKPGVKVSRQMISYMNLSLRNYNHYH